MRPIAGYSHEQNAYLCEVTGNCKWCARGSFALDISRAMRPRVEYVTRPLVIGGLAVARFNIKIIA